MERGSTKPILEQKASEILHKHLDRDHAYTNTASAPNGELLNYYRKTKDRHLLIRQVIRFIVKPVVMLGVVIIVGLFLFWNADPASTPTVMFDSAAHAKDAQIRNDANLKDLQPVAPTSIRLDTPRVDNLPKGQQQSATVKDAPSQTSAIDQNVEVARSPRRPVQPVLTDTMATVGK